VQLREDGTLAIDDLRGGRRFEGLHALENEVEMGDLYNFCPLDGAGVWRCAGASARVLSDGLSRWQLEVSYPGELPVGVDAELRPRSETVALSLTTVVRLVRESDRIEFRTTIDNRANEHRLGRVSARAAPGSIRAEGQFAVVERPIFGPSPEHSGASRPARPSTRSESLRSARSRC
jgi:hypothetical protein